MLLVVPTRQLADSRLAGSFTRLLVRLFTFPLVYLYSSNLSGRLPVKCKIFLPFSISKSIELIFIYLFFIFKLLCPHYQPIINPHWHKMPRMPNNKSNPTLYRFQRLCLNPRKVPTISLLAQFLFRRGGNSLVCKYIFEK